MFVNLLSSFYNSNEFIDFLIKFEVVGIILNVVSLILCPIIASYKGRSVGGWIVGGLLLSIIGLIIVACLPSIANYSNYQSNCSSSSLSKIAKKIEKNSKKVSSDEWECKSCYHKNPPNVHICDNCGMPRRD